MRQCNYYYSYLGEPLQKSQSQAALEKARQDERAVELKQSAALISEQQAKNRVLEAETRLKEALVGSSYPVLVLPRDNLN